MSKKELFQIQNIMDSIIEGLEHLSGLINKRNWEQSVFMLSSIVEGMNACFKYLKSIDSEMFNEVSSIEDSVLLISKKLNSKQFTKTSEIIQFSLKPKMFNLRELFLDKVGNQKNKKNISIGIFHNKLNPIDFSRPKRVEAMNNEAVSQNVKLYYFTSKDIDFKNERIKAINFENGKKIENKIPFPDVIHNIGAGNQTFEEKKLRRKIPFTSFFVGNKYTLPKQMSKHIKHMDLLVPFTVCIDRDNISSFINKHNEFVFKALASNRGENIYFVNKKNNRYVVLDQKKKMILNRKNFYSFIDNVILAKKGSYIIQKYIKTQTKNKEPYHIRAQVQKNNEGKWVITLIYASIGTKDTNLSNLSAGGRNEELSKFLINEYGKEGLEKYDNKLKELAISIAKHLDHIYHYALSELGIDLAIDDKGKVWMHEANNGPVTRFYEEKRAVHTIGYARYIAENGIMYRDFRGKKQILSGQFDYRNSKVPMLNETYKFSLGILVNDKKDLEFLSTFQRIASAYKILVYYFRPIDVDFDHTLIKVNVLLNGEWKERIVEYPEVILDRSSLQSVPSNEGFYKEFEEALFINNRLNCNVTRREFFEFINNSSMNSYMVTEKSNQIIDVLDESESILIYSDSVKVKGNSYFIRKENGNKYIFIDQKQNLKYSGRNLRHKLNHMFETKYDEMIVQKFDTFQEKRESSFLLQVNVVKKNSGWTILKEPEIKNIEENFSYYLKEFLGKKENLSLSLSNFKNKLLYFVNDVAANIECKSVNRFNEFYIELTFDNFWNFKVVNICPYITVDKQNYEEYAKLIVSQAILLNNK